MSAWFYRNIGGLKFCARLKGKGGEIGESNERMKAILEVIYTVRMI